MLGLFNTGGGNNQWRCSDPEIDRLTNLAEFNTDDEERREQYRQINALISNDLCGMSAWFHRANSYLVPPNVGGAREFTNSNDLQLPGDWTAEEWYLIEK